MFLVHWGLLSGNPNSRSVLGNSFQGQASGSSCPPDCQTQISLPPVSAGTIYANYSVWERTWRGLNIGLDKGLTTVIGFADFITFGGSKKASKEFARVLGGDAAAKEWTRDNAEREGSWFHTGGEGLGLAWDIATGGAVAKQGLKAGHWLSSSGRVFGRHKIGLLNRNDILRVGWSWNQKIAKEVFRIGIGSKRGPIHWHINIWPRR